MSTLKFYSRHTFNGVCPNCGETGAPRWEGRKPMPANTANAGVLISRCGDKFSCGTHSHPTCGEEQLFCYRCAQASRTLGVTNGPFSWDFADIS